MANEGFLYQPTRAFNLDGLAKLEQELSVMSNSNATVSCPWFSLKFQVHILKRCGTRELGITVRRLLTCCLTGLELVEKRLFSPIDS